MPPKSVPRKPSSAIAAPAGLASVNLSKTASSATSQLWRTYQRETAPRLKLIDSFMVFVMLSGVACFAYCLLITDFPFNAFLGAFAACVGQFVLLASLRSQVNPDNKATFPTISQERAFADFAFASIVLHFFAFNFLG